MPSKHPRPAVLQRRSTSGSNTKLTLSGLGLPKHDTSSNLQVALNNATKDLPRGKAKKSGGWPNVRFDSTFQFFRSNLKIRPFLLSQQPPSRTASDQQIRSSSKLHLQQQQQQQRTTTGATRSTSSQRSDTASTTKSGKKSGFTLAGAAVLSQEIEDEGDSDDWVSSESLSATPQNQSSDSESGDEDDDVVHNLPSDLNLAGAAHFAISPDDREPPTPTVPQQPPTPVNNVKEQPHHRSSTSPFRREAAQANATVNRVNRLDRERPVVPARDDQESVGDHHYPHSDHHARSEEGPIASTPRPRVILDRDTELPRHLPPVPPSDPPLGPNSTARKPSALNLRLRSDVQDRRQQPASSVHSVPQHHPSITNDKSPSLKANNSQARDQITMTQVSGDRLIRIITKPSYV